MPHQINRKQCAVCGACEATCPTGSVSIHESYEFYVVDQSTCTDCGDCAQVCPSEAIGPAVADAVPNPAP